MTKKKKRKLTRRYKETIGIYIVALIATAFFFVIGIYPIGLIFGILSLMMYFAVVSYPEWEKYKYFIKGDKVECFRRYLNFSKDNPIIPAGRIGIILKYDKLRQITIYFPVGNKTIIIEDYEFDSNFKKIEE